MKSLRFLLIVIAFIALPVLAACGDDDNSGPVQQTANAVANDAKTAANQGVSTVQGNLTAVATNGQGVVTAVKINQKDFSISADNPNPVRGVIRFNIKNDGGTQHQFIVLRTDIPEDQLPVTNGIVNESAAGITKVASLQEVDPGQSQTLTTNALDAGTYVLICNNPAHYQAGMHTTIHVK